MLGNVGSIHQRVRWMRKPELVRVLAGSLLCLTAWGAGATASFTPKSPKLDARAYFLQDFTSGRILAEHNADERLEPASLTKIMTSYVAFHELAEGNINLNDETVVSEKAWRMRGSRMFIEVGTRVSIEALLQGVIVQSGNDASVALAEHIAGSEEGFAALMNDHARELGMVGTNFVNAEGLPHSDHYTTARDMAILTRALIARFPKRYLWHAQKEFTYNEIPQRNRNRLLWRDSSVDGVKTGYTKSAGYCLVTSAKRDDMRLISVVMGSKSAKRRTQQSQALLTYGFRFFETHQVFAAKEPIQSVRVWEGATRMLGLGLAEDLYVTVPRGAYKRLKTEIALTPRLMAPVQAGSAQGVLKLMLGNEALHTRDIVALQSVAKGSLWQRISDKVRSLLE